MIPATASAASAMINILNSIAGAIEVSDRVTVETREERRSEYQPGAMYLFLGEGDVRAVTSDWIYVIEVALKKKRALA